MVKKNLGKLKRGLREVKTDVVFKFYKYLCKKHRIHAELYCIQRQCKRISHEAD